eukprot:scaffold137_cov59-Phaeocystis_antarctica.AAC.5
MLGTSSRVKRKLSSASAENITLLPFGGPVAWGRGFTPGLRFSWPRSDPPRSTGGRSSSELSSDEGGRLSGLVLSKCSSSRSSRSDAACMYARTTNSRASGVVRSIQSGTDAGGGEPTLFTDARHKYPGRQLRLASTKRCSRAIRASDGVQRGVALRRSRAWIDR